jgi:tetratricopeptide (TPR) repeat protein/ferredoxin
MFLWPIAYRLWLGDSLAVRGRELTTSAFWETFPGWIVGALTFLVCGFATVYFLGAKGFCTYACPYGAAFSVAEKLAPLRVRVNEDCEGSGHCTAACSSNVRVHEEVRDFGMVVDSGCMKCGDCVSVCPNEALRFGFGALPLFAAARPKEPGPEPSRRSFPLSIGEELVLAVAFLLAFVTFRGQYGDVPFLMSLGLAGVLAFVVHLGVKLVTRHDLAFRHRSLKRGGRLLPAGRLFVAVLAGIALFWAYSAWLKVEAIRGVAAFAETARPRQAGLAIATDAAPPSTAEVGAARRAAAHFGRVSRWGLFRWRGADSALAWSAWISGDRAQFRTASARAMARHDSPYEMLLLSARDAAEGGNLAGLTAAGERAIALDPARFEAYAGVGMLLARAATPDALATAASFFERGIVHFPASTLLAYNQGIVHAMQGHPEGAIESFRQVLKLDPGHREARENLAGMLAQSGRFPEAAELYREAIASAPGDADLHVLLAQTFLEMGRDTEARQELAAAFAIAPDHPQAQALKSALEVERGAH